MVEVHGKALDYKEREALFSPDRVSDKSNTWLVASSVGGLFKKEPKREIDEYDIYRDKYYKSDARGIGSINSFVKNTVRAVSASQT